MKIWTTGPYEVMATCAINIISESYCNLITRLRERSQNLKHLVETQGAFFMPKNTRRITQWQKKTEKKQREKEAE